MPRGKKNQRPLNLPISTAYMEGNPSWQSNSKVGSRRRVIDGKATYTWKYRNTTGGLEKKDLKKEVISGYRGRYNRKDKGPNMEFPGRNGPHIVKRRIKSKIASSGALLRNEWVKFVKDAQASWLSKYSVTKTYPCVLSDPITQLMYNAQDFTNNIKTPNPFHPQYYPFIKRTDIEEIFVQIGGIEATNIEDRINFNPFDTIDGRNELNPFRQKIIQDYLNWEQSPEKREFKGAYVPSDLEVQDYMEGSFDFDDGLFGQVDMDVPTSSKITTPAVRRGNSKSVTDLTEGEIETPTTVSKNLFLNSPSKIIITTEEIIKTLQTRKTDFGLKSYLLAFILQNTPASSQFRINIKKSPRSGRLLKQSQKLVSKNSLETLWGGDSSFQKQNRKWLTDEIIDAFCSILNNEHEDVLIVDTVEWRFSFRTGNTIIETKKFQSQFENKSSWFFFPTKDVDNVHWYLIEVLFKRDSRDSGLKYQILVWDSLFREIARDIAKDIEKVDVFVRLVYPTIDLSGLPTMGFNFGGLSEIDFPFQKDGASCGIFSITYLIFRVKKEILSISNIYYRKLSANSEGLTSYMFNWRHLLACFLVNYFDQSQSIPSSQTMSTSSVQNIVNKKRKDEPPQKRNLRRRIQKITYGE